MDILEVINNSQWKDADGVRRVSFLMNEVDGTWDCSVIKKKPDGYVSHLVSVSDTTLKGALEKLIAKTNYLVSLHF